MEDMKTGRKAKDTYEVRGEFVDARTNSIGGKMKDAPMVGRIELEIHGNKRYLLRNWHPKEQIFMVVLKCQKEQQMQ